MITFNISLTALTNIPHISQKKNFTFRIKITFKNVMQMIVSNRHRIFIHSLGVTFKGFSRFLIIRTFVSNINGYKFLHTCTDDSDIEK